MIVISYWADDSGSPPKDHTIFPLHVPPVPSLTSPRLYLGRVMDPKVGALGCVWYTANGDGLDDPSAFPAVFAAVTHAAYVV